jgi:putative phage-type endonuclease
MIIVNIEQQSEAWHDIRCGRVTGTRFSDLCAGETTDTYKKLVTNIVCEIITGRAEETYSNATMEAGIENEPLARIAYVDATGIDITEAGFVIPDEDHKYHDWVGISPDGLETADGGIEVKCPFMRTHMNYIKANKLPTEYRHQVQGQLYVTGRKWWDFVSYVEGMKLFIVRVEPDIEMFKIFETRLDKLIIDVQNELKIYETYNLYNE